VIAIFRRESSFNSSFQDADNAIADTFVHIKSEGIKMDCKLNFIIQYALRELFNNAIEHGNNFDMHKIIRYRIDITKHRLKISVVDCGKGFDFNSVVKKQREALPTRCRNRGLTSLMDMGFVINATDRCINASLSLNDYIIKDGRNDQKMDVELNGKTVVLTVNSSIVAVNVKSMIEFTKNALDDVLDYDEILIDLSASEYIDSMGITFLIGLYKTVNQNGKKVILKGLSPTILNLFKIMKLEEIFEMV
jgi:anti-sigma B factor antagonist